MPTPANTSGFRDNHTRGTVADFLTGKMDHVATAGVEDAIFGSSNFTVRGLGLGSTGSDMQVHEKTDLELVTWLVIK